MEGESLWVIFLQASANDLDCSYESVGLNRGHGNITNTILAAKYCKEKMPNLLAIEAGNEPECKSDLIFSH